MALSLLKSEVMKNRKSKARNWHAVNAHFRKAGPMKDRRDKFLEFLEKEVMKDLDEYKRDRPDLTEFLEPEE